MFKTLHGLVASYQSYSCQLVPTGHRYTKSQTMRRLATLGHRVQIHLLMRRI